MGIYSSHGLAESSQRTEADVWEHYPGFQIFQAEKVNVIVSQGVNWTCRGFHMLVSV